MPQLISVEHVALVFIPELGQNASNPIHFGHHWGYFIWRMKVNLNLRKQEGSWFTSPLNPRLIALHVEGPAFTLRRGRMPVLFHCVS